MELAGPEVMLPGKIAPYLSLAVHELGTNALKYGSLRVRDGKVAVSWAQTRPDRVRLSWRERGGPAPTSGSASASGRKGGFGSLLLTKVFEGATGGELDMAFGRDGLQWTAIIPTGDELRL